MQVGKKEKCMSLIEKSVEKIAKKRADSNYSGCRVSGTRI